MSSIVVDGNYRVSDDAIINYARLSPNANLSSEELNTAYKKVLDTGLFRNVAFQQDGQKLIITVEEYPTVNEISFEEFKDGLQSQKIEYVEMDTKPSPLNAILWSSLIETNQGYRTAYYSLFDSQEITYSKEFKKNHELLVPYLDQKIVQQH